MPDPKKSAKLPTRNKEKCIKIWNYISTNSQKYIHHGGVRGYLNSKVAVYSMTTPLDREHFPTGSNHWMPSLQGCWSETSKASSSSYENHPLYHQPLKRMPATTNGNWLRHDPNLYKCHFNRNRWPKMIAIFLFQTTINHFKITTGIH